MNRGGEDVKITSETSGFSLRKDFQRMEYKLSPKIFE
jgi:hypothetical protein